MVLVGEPLALLVTETVPLKGPPLAGEKATLNVALVPAAMLRGVVTPLTLNPVPFAITCETVTVPVPVLVRVACNVLLLPTFTLPKLRLRGLTLRRYDKPNPESETVVGVELAELVRDTVPVAFPPAVGENMALKLALPPACRVKGRAIPLMLKAAPVTVAAVTVRGPDVPVLVTVTLWVLTLPRFTFPKLMVVGLATSARLLRPVPESDTVAGELLAVLVIVTVPEEAFPEVGVKVTLRFT